MMRTYILNLKKYGISKARSIYLISFCRLYNERKAQINDLYFLSSPPFDSMVSGGKISNPTEDRALKAQKLKGYNDIIDQCIRDVCDGNADMMKQLKSNVVDGIPYEKLGWMPCGRNTFFKTRQLFFKALNEKLT